MPGVWEPWPGKRRAVVERFIDRSWRIGGRFSSKEERREIFFTEQTQFGGDERRDDSGDGNMGQIKSVRTKPA